jgi:hypothetical protein
MEYLSTRGAFKKPGSCLIMTVLAVIAVLSLSVTGCGKSKPPVVAQAPDQNTNQTAETIPVYQPPTPAVPATEAVQPPAEPDLKELDRSLLRWILGNRRRPQSFEDFAATAGVTIPPPPAGKKYIIGKDMHIQLVNR